MHEILHTFDDIVGVLRPLWYAPTAEERQAAGDAMSQPDGALSTWLARVDTRLAHNPSGHAVGLNLTIADLQLWNLGHWLTGGTLPITWSPRTLTTCTGKVALPETLLARFPHVNAHFHRIGALPLVHKYFAAGGK